MRPLLMPSSYAPHVGGVEAVVQRLAAGLVAAGDDPLVVTNRWPKSLPAGETLSGVPVRRHVFRVPEPRVRHLGGWLLHSRATTRALLREAVEHGADVVNVQCVSSNGRYGLALAETLDVPLVVSLHGELTMDASGVYGRSAQLRRVWRCLLDRADAVTAPSRYALATAEQVYGRSLADRSHVVVGGVDLSVFAPGSTRRSVDVVAVARLVRVKGMDVLIEAFGRLPAEMGDLDLLVVGDGRERAALVEQARALPQGRRVRFAGTLPPEQVAEQLRGARLFVLPSRDEALGITLLEAMASGVPVVASAVGGVAEVVEDGVTGRLVPAGDVPALTAAMAAVLADPAGAAGLSSAASSRVVAASWDACVAGYLRVFEQVAR